MGFPGFADLYLLREATARKDYRATFDAHDRGVALSRAEDHTDTPVGLTWAMGGGTPGDVVWTTSAAPLVVHARVVQLLRDHEFTGWTTYPVTVTAKNGAIHSDYFGLAIRGRCGPLDLSRSVVGLAEYPGGWVPHFQGHYFVPDTWDGSDLFMESPDALGRVTMSRLFTDRVRRALERAKVRGLGFTALPDVRVSTAVFVIGSPHRLPQDYSARLDAAYAQAGVPRPDWVR